MTRARDLAAFVSNADGDIKFDTDTLFIDSSANRVGIGLSTNISSSLHVDSETSLGPDNNNRMILGSTSGGVGSIGTIEGGTTSFNTMTFTSGNVGIGASSPISALDLSGGADGTPKTMTLAQGNASSKAAAIVGVYGDTNSQGIRFLTNSFGQAERMRILPAGGLTFNGDTAAANALNDYEEGSHVTALTPTTSGSITLSASNKTLGYIKIGKIVHVFGYVRVDSVSSPVGTFRITLPFTVENNNRSRSAVNIKMNNTASLALYNFWAIAENNTAFVEVYNGTANSVAANSAQQLQASTDFRISVTYRTA